MKKIDWYILKKFLVTFIFCLFLFTVVAVAVDSSEKMDDFVKAKMNTGEVLTGYYLGFIPYIWSLLFPLFVFIAVIFFTSRMAFRSEIIAILASGTSYNRFLRPYIIGGLLLGGLLWVGARFWIPKGNIIRGNFQSQFVDRNDPLKNKDDGRRGSYYLRLDTNTFIGILHYENTNKSARGFFMEKIKDNKVIYNLRAESMKWDTTINKWVLTNATERYIDSMGERVQHHSQYPVTINLMHTDLRKDLYMKDKLTTPELTSFIRQEKARGTEGMDAYQVELYRRTATPAAVFLLTIIGASIASRKVRGGSGLHIAVGIIIASLFIVSDRFSTVFATKGNLPPLVAAWFPNMVFAVVAYFLYRKTPK